MNPEIWSVKQSQEKTFHSTTDDVVACWRCFELVGLTTGQMDPQNLSHLVNAKHPFLGSVYLIWLVVLNMFIFQNIWDNPSLTSLFFKMVKTTNQWCLSHSHIIRALFMSGVTHGGFRSHGLPQWSNLKDGDFPMEIPLIQRAWIIGVSQLETTMPPDGFWISWDLPSLVWK